MTFEEILDQAIAMLQRRGRLTYGALKRQFQLDDAYLDDVKAELIEGQRVAVDEDGRVLVWTGAEGPAPPSTASPVSRQDRLPLAYTPPYLAEKILTSKSTLEGERKQVTVLFADLKGSTELIEGLDPEEARTLLDPALHVMMDAVHRFEGTVNQVLGDGIMALFGAPMAHEDHAVRACYAALAMQAAMRRYAEEVRRSHGLEMQARVGLNSGEVVVRAIGNDLHMDYSAVGQTTHLAARMEQLATPGSIRLTAATLRLVEGLVQVNTLGQFPVRGLTEPVEVCELVGASAVRRRLQAAAARGLTHFVGRQQELMAVQQALERAGAGHGQVVAMVGEAGVGKSRLVHEVIHSHRTQGWRVLESASVSYSKATPYFPVLDLLKRYCQIDDGDEARTIRARVTGQILTLDETLQDTLPALLALLDAVPDDSPFLHLDPPQRRQRTLDGLKRVLLRESQVQPLLLVCEDLHWIDTETQALLDRLVESLPAARLLLLVNYRPEYQHGWRNKTYYSQLRLDPLPPASAEALLQSLLGEDAGLAPLTQRLIERTQGNPFFLEESVRTLVETHMLSGDQGAYCLTQALPTIQVPATVQAVLAARIDRLPPEEKQLLQTAAVIGTEVPLPLLQAIADLPETALHRGLAHLQAAEFLYETRLFPAPEYTFKHALTHEVAYNSLLLERRRGLHGRIVEALEALAPERVAEQVERLAHHALRGEVWGKALGYCRQAGERAMERSAHREAVGCFEQALSALTHLPQTPETSAQAIDLHLALRTAIIPLGDPARLFAHMHAAEDLAVQLEDVARQGRIAAYWTRDLGVTGHQYAQAVAYGQRALALLHGDVVLRMTTQLYLSYAYYHLGAYHAAVTLLTEALDALAELPQQARLGAAIPAVVIRHSLVQSLPELGQFADGSRYGHEAVQLAEAAGHAFSLYQACRSLATLYLCQGAFDRAIALLERTLALCQEADIPYGVPHTISRLGWAYAQAGHPTVALAYLEQAGQLAASHQTDAGYAMWLVLLSEGYVAVGRLSAAVPLAHEALAMAQDRQERGVQGYALRLLGALTAQGTALDVVAAARYYQQALALAEELGMRPLAAHCHCGLGTLYATTGQQEQARIALSTAVEMYQPMEMTFWLPEVEAALAQVDA